MSSASFFLDATPLLDANWTGISVVCANVARQLIRRGLQPNFCLQHAIVPGEAVREALERSSGIYLARDLATGRLPTSPVAWPQHRVSVGLSASVKRFNRVFDVECSWIHDISTLLQPEYHTPENVVWHTESIVEDLASNDATVCISQATLDDLVGYLGADPTRLVLAPNGVEWPWWYAVRAKNEPATVDGPYLLVLGTREPRKNLSLVFEMLAAFPEVLTSHRVVLAGGDGWLADHTATPPCLAPAVASGRISAAGFVSDYDKYRLLQGADATLFPSFFEGFGLPVLESLSVGTPCLASFSSSIPAVGGALCHYFDPFSAGSLHDALHTTLARGLKQDASFAAAASAWAARFTWEAGVGAVLAALEPMIERVRAGKAAQTEYPRVPQEHSGAST